MTIPSGVRVGPYEIRSLLGAGGMGEVYRAHDANLNREVALKIVPEGFANDPERMARFQREAKALAALNHPHIAAVYGLEGFRSTRALAMELVEGQTLAELLAAPPSGLQALAIEDALPIAKQIADALEYAHERGIIHRDLKPANIKIAPDGVVKVLDFGLAKTSSSSPGDATEQLASGLDDSPTLNASITGTGIIVGTAAYMSPEQARGKTVDRRTDIWSFGCVLYEMISGRRPFQGETVSDVLAAVLRAEPDWRALPSETPAPIHELLRRCFAKDPRQRLRDIGDARIVIEETMSGEVPARVTATDPPPTGRTSLRQIVPWVASFVLLVATVVLAILYSRVNDSSRAAIVSQILPVEGGFDVRLAGGPQLSPDGRRLAYLAPGREGPPVVWVRRLDSTESPSALKGTEGATLPFWSPDGRRIGFFAGRKLMKIEVSGGPPVEVCDVTLGLGGEWTPDDTILFASSSTSPIFRVSANGGKEEPVTALDSSRQEAGHRLPQLLPDNRHFLYQSVSSSPESSGTYVGSLDGGMPKLVLRGNSRAVYASSGYLLFLQDGAVMAQAFDSVRFEVSGDPVAIAPRRGTESGLSVTASPNGILAYLSGQVVSSHQLQWFDRNGNPGEIVADEQVFFTPRISPDGKEVAVAVASSPTTRDIWIFDLLQSRSPRKLTFDKLHNWTPVWSPDGKKVVFSTNPTGQFHIYGKASDGTGTALAILDDDATHYVDSWSGDYIAYARGDQKGTPAWDIWALALSGGRKPFPFLQSAFNKEEPSLSPDGKWIAYVADETRNWEVYIAPFPKGDGKWLVSTGGGRQPRWRGDGKELFYMAAGNQLIAAEIQERDASIEVVKRQELFQTNAAPSNFRNYDVAADGKRFLLVTQSQSKGLALNLIVNWQDLLSNSRRQ